MGRNATRTTTLSLDTVAVIRRLYPRQLSFWENHLKDSFIDAQYFYGAMRGIQISPEAEQLIESSVEYDLRHLDVDRDELALIPEFNIETLLPEMLEFMERITKGQDEFNEEQRLKLLVKLRLMSFILRNSKDMGR